MELNLSQVDHTESCNVKKLPIVEYLPVIKSYFNPHLSKMLVKLAETFFF
jgi:hypothetical protein